MGTAGGKWPGELQVPHRDAAASVIWAYCDSSRTPMVGEVVSIHMTVFTLTLPRATDESLGPGRA